jgi:hypothetical protein
MLTFWLRGSLDDITPIVMEIKSDMDGKNIPIIRTKIEAMAHNEGIPDECTDEHYFEFHFKVNIKNTNEWNKLVSLIIPFGGHLFYNPYNKTLKPIVTIRRYTSLTDLTNVYEQVVKILKENDLEIDSLEKEYSIYDSNVYLDNNWLFEDNPKTFINYTKEIMQFAY